MKKFVSTVLLWAGFAALSSVTATAQPVQPPQGACLQQNRVDGWKVIDDQTLIVNDRTMRKFKVSLAKGCHDLKWPMHLGFSAGTGFGISCVERHSFLIVPPGGGQIAQRCLIDDVQPYSDASQHADAGNNQH
jgi:Family of unknown function (DUF6491)